MRGRKRKTILWTPQCRVFFLRDTCIETSKSCLGLKGRHFCGIWPFFSQIKTLTLHRKLDCHAGDRGVGQSFEVLGDLLSPAAQDAGRCLGEVCLSD